MTSKRRSAQLLAIVLGRLNVGGWDEGGHGSGKQHHVRKPPSWEDLRLSIVAPELKSGPSYRFPVGQPAYHHPEIFRLWP